MMYQKSRFPKSGFINVLLMSTMSICAVICGSSPYCPVGFNGGYVDQSCSRLLGTNCSYYCNYRLIKTRDMVNCGIDGNWYPDENSLCIMPAICPSTFNGGYISPLCSRRSGAWCAYYCNQNVLETSRMLTCGTNGHWIPDKNSTCLKSVDQTSSDSESSPVSGGVIAGITTAVGIVMLIISAIVVWKSRRSRVNKSTRNATVHAGNIFLSPTENLSQNFTTIQEHINEDGIDSAPAFECPSYNGLDFHLFLQRIQAISRSFTYHELPPSYNGTQNSINESPPTYKEVVTDPTRFNLYT